MKTIALIFSLFLFCCTAKAQLSLTPAQSSAIDKKVEKQLAEYKAKLSKQKEYETLNEFKVDTLRLND